MNNRPGVRWLGCAATLIAATSLAAGCADAHHVDVMTVLAQGNCQTEKTGVQLIDYATLASYRGTHLIGMTESSQAQQNPAHLIAIAPGQFPTAGYSVQLLDGSTLADKLLTINIKVERPPADAMLAQMITHPCLVVGVADPAVARVRVLNDTEVLGEVEIPAAQ
jgi:hypothetical protein